MYNTGAVTHSEAATRTAGIQMRNRTWTTFRMAMLLPRHCFLCTRHADTFLPSPACCCPSSCLSASPLLMTQRKSTFVLRSSHTVHQYFAHLARPDHTLLSACRIPTAQQTASNRRSVRPACSGTWPHQLLSLFTFAVNRILPGTMHFVVTPIGMRLSRIPMSGLALST